MSPSPEPLRSFVPVDADSHFPIQNLPYGIFSPAGHAPRTGIAIGDHVLDLAELARSGLLPVADAEVFSAPSLNPFIALGRACWRDVRAVVTAILRHDNPSLRDHAELRSRCLIPMDQVQMHLPVEVRGYSDFYASREHATNVGTMFRGADKALPDNWLHLPIGYNGRASSVVVSGTPIRRPNGQTKMAEWPEPQFGPCRKLDFELELAAIVGRGSELGTPVPVSEADEHIFGLVLLNDWSARDIQHWEYVPLGPFNAKTFATSISPWVVTLEALAPFRTSGPAQNPVPLPYLRQDGPTAFDISLAVRMRAGDSPWATVSETNARHLYWSFAQQLAHHTVSGCNLVVGDLIGSGTISGHDQHSRGSLLEITWNGRDPLTLAGGESRCFIEDGDEIEITGWCQAGGYRIGFGTVDGRVTPAPR